MKKLVFGILIFAVVAVSITGALISVKLNENENKLKMIRYEHI